MRPGARKCSCGSGRLRLRERKARRRHVTRAQLCKPQRAHAAVQVGHHEARLPAGAGAESQRSAVQVRFAISRSRAQRTAESHLRSVHGHQRCLGAHAACGSAAPPTRQHRAQSNPGVANARTESARQRAKTTHAPAEERERRGAALQRRPGAQRPLPQLSTRSLRRPKVCQRACCAATTRPALPVHAPALQSPLAQRAAAQVVLRRRPRPQQAPPCVPRVASAAASSERAASHVPRPRCAYATRGGAADGDGSASGTASRAQATVASSGAELAPRAGTAGRVPRQPRAPLPAPLASRRRSPRRRGLAASAADACSHAVPPASLPLFARCGLSRLPRRAQLRSPSLRARSRCLALRSREARQASARWRMTLPPRVAWLRSRATWLRSTRPRRRTPARRARRDAATRRLQTTVVLGLPVAPPRFTVSPPPPPPPLLPWRARRRPSRRCRCAPQRQQQRPARAARCCLGTASPSPRFGRRRSRHRSKLTPRAGGRHQGAAGGCWRGLPRLLREARAG